MAVCRAAKPFPPRPGGAPMAQHWLVRQMTFIHLNRSDPSTHFWASPTMTYILYRLLIITRFSRAA